MRHGRSSRWPTWQRRWRSRTIFAVKLASPLSPIMIVYIIILLQRRVIGMMDAVEYVLVLYSTDMVNAIRHTTATRLGDMMKMVILMVVRRAWDVRDQTGLGRQADR